MPIHKGKDSNGTYYQYGTHGKKYYYKKNDKVSEKKAHIKAIKQAIAIYSSGYKE